MTDCFRYIKLEFNSLSLTIDSFADDKPPQSDIDSSRTGRSDAGNLLVYGIAYEVPRIWQFTTVLTEETRRTLMDIWEESDYRRRRPGVGDPKILLTDTITELTERGNTRTRGKAPSPHDAEITTTTGISYYATYYTWFVKKPSPVGWGLRYAVTLEETEIKTTP